MLGILGGSESGYAATSRSMAKKTGKDTRSNPEAVPGQSARLKTLRKAFSYQTATAFAVFLDIDVKRYTAFENGSPLSREVAFRIVQRLPGVSLDWLYFGKVEGLPLELARRLGVLDPPPGKRASV